MAKNKSLKECPSCGHCWATTTDVGKINLYLPQSNMNNWGKTAKFKIICDDCGYKMWHFPRTGRITRRNK